MTNKDIFKAFHETLLKSGDNNNTWWLFNEDKTALLIYTESDPNNINRLLIERESDKYIDIDKVKQARQEIEDRIDNYPDRDTSEYEDCLAILDSLIEESEEK